MQTQHQIRSARVRPVCAGLPDPNARLLGIIRDWARKRGRDLPSYWELSRPDERFAQFCAGAGERSDAMGSIGLRYSRYNFQGIRRSAVALP
jgi:hypothetical protein